MNDEIDSCRYLFLRELSEPEDNALRVLVEEAKADDPEEDVEIAGVVVEGSRAIEPDESCRLFELVWPSYVAYGVRNESFTAEDESEAWQGRLLRVYSTSHFLDYVAKGTFADDKFPGPLRHWCLVCLHHIVDVVGSAEPELRRLRPAPWVC